MINNTKKPILYVIVTLISASAVFSAVYADDISNLIGDTGFVGIGTTTPTAELDVVGDIKLSGNLISDGDICIGNCSDNNPPIILLTGNNPQTIELGSGYLELGATTDDGSPVTIDSSTFVDAVGTYSILYDSIDAADNSSIQVIRTVEVVSTLQEILVSDGGTGTNGGFLDGNTIYTRHLSGVLDEEATITAIALDYFSNAGGNIKIGLYGDNLGAPNNLYGFEEFPTSGTGVQTFTFATPILKPAGSWFVAISGDTSYSVLRGDLVTSERDSSTGYAGAMKDPFTTTSIAGNGYWVEITHATTSP